MDAVVTDRGSSVNRELDVSGDRGRDPPPPDPGSTGAVCLPSCDKVPSRVKLLRSVMMMMTQALHTN